MSSDDVECSNYSALNANNTCASNTTKGICHYCDPGYLLKKS